MSLESPRLKPIDEELLLFGKIHLSWTDVDAPIYYVFRDYEPVRDVSGWQPYQIIEEGKTQFDDSFFENNTTYYYAVMSVSEDENEKSDLSNTEKVKVDIPPNLIVDKHQLEEAAYYESRQKSNYEQKAWELARYQVIFEKTFPERDMEYLKTQVKTLKDDLPEFDGLFHEPTESEIKKRLGKIYEEKASKMDLDWRLSELKLIKKKLEDLVEYETEVR